MSKDMLGSIVRALVGVPQEYLGVTLDFANKLGGKDGAAWKARFAEVLSERVAQMDAPALLPVEFDPAQFIEKGWKWETKDEDPRSLAFTAIDFSKVVFTTCLKKGEPSITGEEKLKRLIASNNIRLDPRFGVALFQEEGHETLERLYEKHEISYLDFFGRILVDPRGDRCVLYLYRNDGKWHWSVIWLGDDWGGRNFSAVLAS